MQPRETIDTVIIGAGVIGLAIASPVLLLQFFGWRRERYGDGA